MGFLERAVKLRAHHVGPALGYIDGDSLGCLAAAAGLDLNKKVILTESPDGYCDNCQRNPSSPNFNRRLKICNPDSKELILRDRYCISQINAAAAFWHIKLPRKVKLEHLWQILYAPK